MLHAVKSNQGTSSPETSLAMDRDDTRLSLRLSQELVDDVIRWRSSIKEVQIKMLDPILDEFLFIVLGLVEADYKGYSKFLENWHIIFWGE